jgi:hypothetical protein
MKRGRLYAAARGHGYNVLALGQHLDDLTESFLMSVFHNGRLRTMKAHYYIQYVIIFHSQIIEMYCYSHIGKMVMSRLSLIFTCVVHESVK